MAPMVTFSFHGELGLIMASSTSNIIQSVRRVVLALLLFRLQAYSAPCIQQACGQQIMLRFKTDANNCHKYGATIMMQLHCGNMDINGCQLKKFIRCK
jgi:hypothetical protein